jgi:hypothetical protein
MAYVISFEGTIRCRAPCPTLHNHKKESNMNHFDNVTFNRVWPGPRGPELMNEIVPMSKQTSRTLYRLMQGFVGRRRIPDDVRLAAAYDWKRRHEDRHIESLPWTYRASVFATILIAAYEQSSLAKRAVA